MAIIASKGTLDMAYTPLVLASSAVCLDMEVGILFILYGVDVVNKKKNRSLMVTPLANPALPFPIHFPDILGVLPGMTSVTTMMVKHMLKKLSWPPIPDLVNICIQSGVRMIAFTPTLEMTGVKKSDLVEGVEIAGVAEFIDFALDANITLFI